MEDKSDILIAFPLHCLIFQTKDKRTKEIAKWVQSLGRKNAVTNILTILAVFLMTVLAILSVFFFLNYYQILIWITKYLPTTLCMPRKIPFFSSYRFVTGNWFQLLLFCFICAIEEMTYPSLNIENFSIFYFETFKIIFFNRVNT